MERFYDGLSAEVKTVHVTVSTSGLVLENRDLGIKKIWKYADIKILDFPEESHPCILTSAEEPEARLHLSDRQKYQALRQKLPKHIGLPHLQLSWHMVPMFLVMAVVVMLAIYYTMPKASGVMARYIPEKWDKALGKRVVSSVVADHKVCNHKAATAALEKMLERLETGMEKPRKIDLKVVLWPDTPNAFTAPGNQIVLMSGLIDKAESPDEVAGVLAHEMGHAALRHPTQAALQSLGWTTMLAALSGGSQSSGKAAQIAVTLISLKHSRNAEFAADKAGLAILEKAHISPAGLVAFFKRISSGSGTFKFKGAQMLDYLSTHPAAPERVKMLEHLQKKNNPTTPSLSTEEWMTLRNICKSTYSEAPQ